MSKNKSEYKNLLIAYNSPIYFPFSPTVPESEWSKPQVAEEYLEKYWLPLAEYQTNWKPIQDRMFVNQQEGLPKLKFAKQYEMIALRGGMLFGEADFKQLQKCIQYVGDKYFVVIENTFGYPDEMAFRMKFPASITWEEIMSGSFISAALIYYAGNEYFVFGESGSWGKYAANDYENPVDIIGFEKKYAPFFRETFKVSEEEEREIAEWIPPHYLDTNE